MAKNPNEDLTQLVEEIRRKMDSILQKISSAGQQRAKGTGSLAGTPSGQASATDRLVNVLLSLNNFLRGEGGYRKGRTAAENRERATFLRALERDLSTLFHRMGGEASRSPNWTFGAPGRVLPRIGHRQAAGFFQSRAVVPARGSPLGSLPKDVSADSRALVHVPRIKNLHPPRVIPVPANPPGTNPVVKWQPPPPPNYVHLGRKQTPLLPPPKPPRGVGPPRPPGGPFDPNWTWGRSNPPPPPPGPEPQKPSWMDRLGGMIRAGRRVYSHMQNPKRVMRDGRERDDFIGDVAAGVGRGSYAYGRMREEGYSRTASTVRAVGAAARDVPEYGKTIEAVSQLGAASIEAYGKILRWAEGMKEANLQLSDFSGGMALAEARQQMRDVTLGQQRGDRLADSTDALANALHQNNMANARFTDPFSMLGSYIAAGLVQVKAGIQNLILDALGFARYDQDTDKSLNLNQFMSENALKDWDEVKDRPARFGGP